jgi:hypothetical protein
MFQRVFSFLLIVLLAFQPAVLQAKEQDQDKTTVRQVLTDAAIIALIIAASVAAYKASGRPCACPEDRTRSGRRCGGNSAWSRPGGAKPLCRATDVTADMISSYRAQNEPLK